MSQMDAPGCVLPASFPQVERNELRYIFSHRGYHHVVTDNDIVIIEERTVLVIVEPYSLFEPIITTR